MVTYNHEKFIAEAIESVLMQQRSFPIELVIGEDCSTDNTREIVATFAREHPIVIRPLLHEKNVGPHRNHVAVLDACRGEYIAFLDGDDYWTELAKLQQQVEFLDANPAYSMCFHDALVVGDHGRDEPWRWCHSFNRTSSSFEDLAHGLYIPTCAAVIRNGLVQWAPPWTEGLGMGDWPLFLLVAQHGKIHFTNRIMAHYRRHPGGLWSGTKDLANSYKMLHTCEVLREVFQEQKATGFDTALFFCWCDLASKHSSAKEFALTRTFRTKARQYALRNIRVLFGNPNIQFLNLLKILIRLFFQKTPW